MGSLLAITPEPGIATVVITGISLVFAILVVLALVILGQGKIFDEIARKKAEEEKQKKASALKEIVPEPEPEAEPVIQEGIPPEVVAAIVAAISSMGDGKYHLRAVRRGRRDGWSMAGVAGDTEPF